MKVACTELSDWPAGAAEVTGDCIQETRGHFSLEKRWMRTYERTTQVVLWVFSSEMTKDVSDRDIRAC